VRLSNLVEIGTRGTDLCGGFRAEEQRTKGADVQKLRGKGPAQEGR
jgi:hypothetical protein